jgi:hypothetical protein
MALESGAVEVGPLPLGWNVKEKGPSTASQFQFTQRVNEGCNKDMDKKDDRNKDDNDTEDNNDDDDMLTVSENSICSILSARRSIPGKMKLLNHLEFRVRFLHLDDEFDRWVAYSQFQDLLPQRYREAAISANCWDMKSETINFVWSPQPLVQSTSSSSAFMTPHHSLSKAPSTKTATAPRTLATSILPESVPQRSVVLDLIDKTMKVLNLASQRSVEDYLGLQHSIISSFIRTDGDGNKIVKYLLYKFAVMGKSFDVLKDMTIPQSVFDDEILRRKTQSITGAKGQLPSLRLQHGRMIKVIDNQPCPPKALSSLKAPETWTAFETPPKVSEVVINSKSSKEMSKIGLDVSSLSFPTRLLTLSSTLQTSTMSVPSFQEFVELHQSTLSTVGFPSLLTKSPVIVESSILNSTETFIKSAVKMPEEKKVNVLDTKVLSHKVMNDITVPSHDEVMNVTKKSTSVLVTTKSDAVILSEKSKSMMTMMKKKTKKEVKTVVKVKKVTAEQKVTLLKKVKAARVKAMTTDRNIRMKKWTENKKKMLLSDEDEDADKDIDDENEEDADADKDSDAGTDSDKVKQVLSDKVLGKRSNPFKLSDHTAIGLQTDASVFLDREEAITLKPALKKTKREMSKDATDVSAIISAIVSSSTSSLVSSSSSPDKIILDKSLTPVSEAVKAVINDSSPSLVQAEVIPPAVTPPVFTPPVVTPPVVTPPVFTVASSAADAAVIEWKRSVRDFVHHKLSRDQLDFLSTIGATDIFGSPEKCIEISDEKVSKIFSMELSKRLFDLRIISMCC